jgi:hypothetical protein
MPGAIVIGAGRGIWTAVIAEHYWRLHTQPAGAWEREVVH